MHILRRRNPEAAPLASAVFALLMLTITPILRADDTSDLPRPTRFSGIVHGPSLEAGLKLRDGRTLYRGPRSLRESYPYLVAATEQEASEKYGYALDRSTVHQILEPLASAEAAVELTRWLTGGEIVPDRAAFDRMLEIAKHYKMPERSWPVKIKEFVPTHFGLKATRVPEGYEVRGTIFETSGGSALTVVEYHITYPVGEKPRIAQNHAIVGPPQSWQTSMNDAVGSVGYEEKMKKMEHRQRKLREAVEEFRDRMLRALRKDLTVDTFRTAIAGGATWAQVRHSIGEPNRTRGSKRGDALYHLGNGTVIAIPPGIEDASIPGAVLYESFDLDRGLGKILEALTARR